MDDFVTTIITKDVPKCDFLFSITKEPQNFDEATKQHDWIQVLKLKFNLHLDMKKLICILRAKVFYKMT
jgi:hypothetical protein